MEHFQLDSESRARDGNPKVNVATSPTSDRRKNRGARRRQEHHRPQCPVRVTHVVYEPRNTLTPIATTRRTGGLGSVALVLAGRAHPGRKLAAAG